MHSFSKFLVTTNQSIRFFLGVVVLVLVISVISTTLNAKEVLIWANQVFGLSFLTLFSVLVLVFFFCCIKYHEIKIAEKDPNVWLEAGLQCANGIATLAITYTLLGISLGIGSLADQELTPQTIHSVIGELTKHFSMAFLTTVLGLPTSSLLRAIILITMKNCEKQTFSRFSVLPREVS